jgi:serine/threonine protein kinase
MRIHNYELGEAFLTAGPSTFYRAQNVVLGHPVVVRRLAIDAARADDVRATFYREARHAASLWHARIWRPLDVLEAEGALWSVHEDRTARISGDMVREQGPFTLAAAARLGVQMADALAHMHAKGSVHGKVAPAFVTVDSDGNGQLINLVKSADLAAGIWPLRPIVLGLSPFSAPEEFRGERPTAASDHYGLAATLLHWLTGRYPRGGADAAEALERARAGAPVDTTGLRRELPANLAAALKTALEPDPRQRHGSVAALGSMLAELERRHGADVPAGFEPGTSLARVCEEGEVRIVERHGAGAHGIVFRASVGEAACPVAVKALKPEHRGDQEALERFLREARALEAVESPYVVHIYGVGEQRGTPYAVMEFIDGPDLATLLLREGTLAPRRAARLAAAVARGLEAIHLEGIVHRDLKPHNVLVAPDDRPVIADFGVAHSSRAARLTMTGQLVGSPAYMSPEQLEHKPVTAAADLWSLGAMLYELLAGQPPFVGTDTLLTLKRIREEPHPPLPATVPPALAAIVDRMLAKDPARRHASARDVADALEAVVAALEGHGDEPDRSLRDCAMADEGTPTHAPHPTSRPSSGP